jgi:hypothetical protein
MAPANEAGSGRKRNDRFGEDSAEERMAFYQPNSAAQSAMGVSISGHLPAVLALRFGGEKQTYKGTPSIVGELLQPRVIAPGEKLAHKESSLASEPAVSA